jgi:2-keto-4-pentenoate hydratase/2-oxohepta-3-ene-1,7-dioic acid hydratase in catechol pathway
MRWAFRRSCHLTTWVNGELRQRAPVEDLIFDIPTLIETISAAITLEPGDIIATGTPAGVGIGFSPPKFLKPGDVCASRCRGSACWRTPSPDLNCHTTNREETNT